MRIKFGSIRCLGSDVIRNFFESAGTQRGVKVAKETYLMTFIYPCYSCTGKDIVSDEPFELARGDADCKASLRDLQLY